MTNRYEPKIIKALPRSHLLKGIVATLMGWISSTSQPAINRGQGLAFLRGGWMSGWGKWWWWKLHCKLSTKGFPAWWDQIIFRNCSQLNCLFLWTNFFIPLSHRPALNFPNLPFHLYYCSKSSSVLFCSPKHHFIFFSLESESGWKWERKLLCHCICCSEWSSVHRSIFRLQIPQMSNPPSSGEPPISISSKQSTN